VGGEARLHQPVGGVGQRDAGRAEVGGAAVHPPGGPPGMVGDTSAKATGLAQKLGQLETVNRDLQSKSWANLKLLGQPCNFHACRTAGNSG
jgi:hypothetical protein